MPDHHPYDESKFEELLLYLAQRSEGDEWFGAVKLHKLLFYSEFRAYQRLGKPITGAVFQNLPQGPAAKRLLPVRTQLIERGDAKIAHEPTTAGVQQRLIALREPKKSVFSDEELSIIEEVIKELWGRTGSEVSRDSHEEPGWIVTTEREAIPYYMALLSRPDPTEEDEIFLRERVERAAVSRRS